MSTWQSRLAASAAGVTAEHLSEPVLDRLRTLILHNLGWGLAALDRPAAQAARRLAPMWGEGRIPLLGGGRAGLMGAMFANATSMAASIQEDAWNGQHLGSVVLPTALALAEDRGNTGTELLVALAAGYGAAMAAAARYGAFTGARGFRGTALYGQLGAAVTAAKLCGLDAAGIERALAIAAGTVGGVPGPLLAGTDEVLFQSGLSAVKGTFAALAAAEPISASADAFDGRGFFGAAYAGVEPGQAVAHEVPTAEELAQLVLEVGVRPYPLNHLGISPVAAALRATGSRAIRPEEVVSLEVWMPAGEARAVQNPGPFARPMQAMFSVPLAVAGALCDGSLTLESLQRRALDSEALALARRVVIHPTEGMAPLTARVSVVTAGGQLEAEVGEPGEVHRPGFVEAAAGLRAALPEPTRGRLEDLAGAVGALPGAVWPLLEMLH